MSCAARKEPLRRKAAPVPKAARPMPPAKRGFEKSVSRFSGRPEGIGRPDGVIWEVDVGVAVVGAVGTATGAVAGVIPVVDMVCELGSELAVVEAEALNCYRGTLGLWLTVGCCGGAGKCGAEREHYHITACRDINHNYHLHP